MSIKSGRLIRKRGGDSTTLEDFVYIIMFNIEDSLITAGAKPETDYTYRDLLQAAMPIVVEQWKSNYLTFSDSDNILIRLNRKI